MTWPLLRKMRSAFSLSAIAKVLISTSTLRGSLMVAMARTVSMSACGLGRLVRMVGTFCATPMALEAISTPARLASRRRAALMS
jgi:hypothetical protein